MGLETQFKNIKSIVINITYVILSHLKLFSIKTLRGQARVNKKNFNFNGAKSGVDFVKYQSALDISEWAYDDSRESDL